jgi:hypothetical protein
MSTCPDCGRIVLAAVIGLRQDGCNFVSAHPDVCAVRGDLRCLTLALTLARAGLGAALAREARLRSALGLDQPWPVPDVLDVLAKAASHLLSAHSCDDHGHEITKECAGRATVSAVAIRAVLAGDAPRGVWVTLPEPDKYDGGPEWHCGGKGLVGIWHNGIACHMTGNTPEVARALAAALLAAAERAGDVKGGG